MSASLTSQKNIIIEVCPLTETCHTNTPVEKKREYNSPIPQPMISNQPYNTCSSGILVKTSSCNIPTTVGGITVALLCYFPIPRHMGVWAEVCSL